MINYNEGRENQIDNHRVHIIGNLFIDSLFENEKGEEILKEINDEIKRNLLDKYVKGDSMFEKTKFLKNIDGIEGERYSEHIVCVIGYFLLKNRPKNSTKTDEELVKHYVELLTKTPSKIKLFVEKCFLETDKSYNGNISVRKKLDALTKRMKDEITQILTQLKLSHFGIHEESKNITLFGIDIYPRGLREINLFGEKGLHENGKLIPDILDSSILADSGCFLDDGIFNSALVRYNFVQTNQENINFQNLIMISRLQKIIKNITSLYEKLHNISLSSNRQKLIELDEHSFLYSINIDKKYTKKISTLILEIFFVLLKEDVTTSLNLQDFINGFNLFNNVYVGYEKSEKFNGWKRKIPNDILNWVKSNSTSSKFVSLLENTFYAEISRDNKNIVIENKSGDYILIEINYNKNGKIENLKAIAKRKIPNVVFSDKGGYICISDATYEIVNNNGIIIERESRGEIDRIERFVKQLFKENKLWDKFSRDNNFSTGEQEIFIKYVANIVPHFIEGISALDRFFNQDTVGLEKLLDFINSLSLTDISDIEKLIPNNIDRSQLKTNHENCDDIEISYNSHGGFHSVEFLKKISKEIFVGTSKIPGFSITKPKPLYRDKFNINHILIGLFVYGEGRLNGKILTSINFEIISKELEKLDTLDFETIKEDFIKELLHRYIRTSNIIKIENLFNFLQIIGIEKLKEILDSDEKLKKDFYLLSKNSIRDKIHDCEKTITHFVYDKKEFAEKINLWLIYNNKGEKKEKTSLGFSGLKNIFHLENLLIYLGINTSGLKIKEFKKDMEEFLSYKEIGKKYIRTKLFLENLPQVDTSMKFIKSGENIEIIPKFLEENLPKVSKRKKVFDHFYLISGNKSGTSFTPKEIDEFYSSENTRFLSCILNKKTFFKYIHTLDESGILYESEKCCDFWIENLLQFIRNFYSVEAEKVPSKIDELYQLLGFYDYLNDKDSIQYENKKNFIEKFFNNDVDRNSDLDSLRVRGAELGKNKQYHIVFDRFSYIKYLQAKKIDEKKKINLKISIINSKIDFLRKFVGLFLKQ